MLETQELEDAQVDSWVQTESSLVWAEGRVELDSVTTVDLDGSLVIFPDDSELDDSLWDGDNLEGGLVFWVGFEKSTVLEGRGEFWSELLVLCSLFFHLSMA